MTSLGMVRSACLGYSDSQKSNMKYIHNVRVSPKETPLQRPERCDGKLSRTVLRGLGAGNSPRLPDPRKTKHVTLLAA